MSDDNSLRMSVNEGGGAAISPAAQPVLELKGVGKQFGAIRALQGVDLSIGAGEVVGVMGDNGAGKSTLVRIIAGNFPPSQGSIHFCGREVHFHRPSEHQIGGKNYPMEAHFVHRAASGGLAVVGVLMTTGRPNPAFAQIVATMPDKEGPAVKADARINPNQMLPNRRSYYRYAGSLTTPPCSEVVEWLLLADPIQVAEADVAKFAKLYPMNARPVQKLDRRFVLQGV